MRGAFAVAFALLGCGSSSTLEDGGPPDGSFADATDATITDAAADAGASCPGPYQWTIQTLAPLGDAPSMAIDSAGNVHVAYLVGGAVMYGKLAPDGGWSTSVVQQDGGVHSTGIAADEHGGVHVVYDWMPADAFVYAYSDGGAFTSSSIASPAAIAGAAQYCSIVIDSNQRPQIALDQNDYLDGGATPFHVLRARPGLDGGWEVDVVDTTSYQVTDGVGIAAGDAGVRLAWSVTGSYPRFAAETSDGGWQVENLPLTQSTRDIALALDTSGAPHMVTESAGFNSPLAYLSRAPDGGWSEQTIFGTSSQSAKSLAFDRGGEAHVSLSGLAYAHLPLDGGWTTETVEATNGLFNAIGIDPQGRVHIVYQSGTSSGYAVKHAYRCP